MRSAWLIVCLVVLTAASCGFPRLPELPAGGGNDGGTNDGGPLALDLELLAGNPDGPGNVDGTGAAARFNFPTGVAVDGAGNVYVADAQNHTIRKVTAAGVVTTLAGTPGMFGSADGTGVAARFTVPTGVAVDSTGNVYVADTQNHTIRKITAAGVVTTLAGTAGMSGNTDGTGAAARFFFPEGVAVDGAGNVYVADTMSQTLRKVTAAGVVTTLAGTAGMAGSADGTGVAARFNSPTSVAVDSAGNVYVADGHNNTVRKVTGAGVVTTLAGTPNTFGSDDGFGANARFNFPQGVAVNGAGNVYIADTTNATVRKITAAGVVTTIAGTAGLAGSEDGTGLAARFNFPVGVAADSAGNIFVADTNNHTLRKVTPAGVVTTLAGTPLVAGSADGTGTDASFNSPQGVAVDSAGNVYVADWGNHTLRKVTPSGVVTTLAGAAGMTGSADGTGADARFYYPIGVAVDSAGNVYVVEQNNRTLRKVTPTGVVTTLAGTAGMAGSADGAGAAARFNDPIGVALDSAGNAYVTDGGNHTLRKVTPSGIVTTLAGTAGMAGSADGTGDAARFTFPGGIGVDGAGNVYVTDFGDSTVRKITPTETTTTVAGTAGVAGVLLGATPRFAFPNLLTIVGDSLVVADNNAILLLRHGAR